ncbi:hypothetical protein [Ereboglobus luteus]|nr:hypothetical protein [Ereboglobus luteus]
MKLHDFLSSLVGASLAMPLRAVAMLSCALGLCLGASAQGVSQAGIGPRAIDSFGLERPNTDTYDTQTAKLSFDNIKNPLANVSLPSELLKASGDGRVLLFSVARLSEEDLQNPFEVRVQVAVDVMETVVEIGGIVESVDGKKNTVILLTRPPKVRAASSDPKGAKAEQEKPVPRVYSVGDVVEGFRIHSIGRDSIIIEQSERYVEVTRGRPVTVCVPLSAM